MTRGEAENVQRQTGAADKADFAYEGNLLPFGSYRAFMTFMEQQWEKTGNDDTYREAMEYLRQAEVELGVKRI